MPAESRPANEDYNSSQESQAIDASASQGAKRRAPTRKYIPQYRSGGWAILRALNIINRDEPVTKAEIIRVAHPFCDSSFETPLDNKYYTAWSSMKTLLQKEYVYKVGNPPRFALTEEGATIAATLARTDDNFSSKRSGDNDISKDAPSEKRRRSDDLPERRWIPPDSLGLFEQSTQIISSRPAVAQVISSLGNLRVIPAGSYTIQLIMDNREIHETTDRSRLEKSIAEKGITYSLRSLDIGDALWIAKCASGEYVLEYIVERKRMDDLVGSIKDGRFHEQKVVYSDFVTDGSSA